MPSPTPNKGYTYPAHGGAVNAWDSPLNADFDQIDLNVAGVYNITLSTTTVAVTYNSTFVTAPSTVTTLTPPSSIVQNLYYLVSGTITANLTINFPAVGGLYVINNQSSGSFTVSAANAGGGTTVNIGSGGTTTVVSEGPSNMDQANSNNVARLYTYFGDPNGAVSGQQATANGGVTDFVWDVTNKRLNASNGGTFYQVVAPSLPTFQTYLSPANGIPIITGDTTSSAVYMNRYIGSWVTLPTTSGGAYYPYQSTADFKLLLTNLNSSDIYDIYLTQTSSIGPLVVTGPSWTVGGGSNTPGTCARGVGAGSAQIVRATQGFYVNANAMTLTNGTTAIAGFPAGSAVLLGSVLTSSAGAVVCHRSVGQNRRWGISNVYNKANVRLQVTDPTASWTVTSSNYRASNGSSANSLSLFQSLAEEVSNIEFTQQSSQAGSNTQFLYIGIGENSLTAASGYNPQFGIPLAIGVAQSMARYAPTTPSLGTMTYTSLERSTGGSAAAFLGTQQFMLLSGSYRA